MKHRKLLVSLLVILLAADFVSGQTALTSLRGTVTDPAGGVVPGAQVDLENAASGFHASAKTGSDGQYEFPQIAPGLYTIKVTMAGFGTQSKQAELLVSQPATINFTLSVEESKVVVEVSIEAQTINTTDASIGNSVNNKTVEALPMEGRNVPDLLSLQPGVLYLGQKFNDISSTSRDTDSRSGAVAGARSDQSNVTLDGVDNNDQRQGYAFTGVLRSTLDSLQEFRVTTSSAGSENGRSSGAQVVLVTKSGTNQLHGSIYEFNRTNFGHANDPFNKTAQLQQGLPNKPGSLIRNTFGAALGGPIKKDKLFFFLNYEGQRTAENQQLPRTVPTQSFRDGTLKYTDAGGNVVTLCSGISITNGKCPNASPKDDLAAMDPNCQSNETCPWGPGANPNSLATFAAYPLPNSPGGDGGLNTAGFTFSAPNPKTLNTYIAKLDYELPHGSHLFIRGIQQGDRISSAPQFPGGPPNSTITDTSKGIAAGYLWTISPYLYNNLRYGYIRQELNVTGGGTASYSDFTGLSTLTSESRSTLLNVPVHNFADDLTWVKGRHSLQFGGNWRIIHNNTSSDAVSFNSATTGAANISQAQIAGSGQSLDPGAFGYPHVGGNTTSYDNAVTAITGLLSTINANNNYKVSRDGSQATLVPSGSLIARNFKANEFEWYVQDAYRLRSNLTVTVGVRYSLLQTPYEVNGQQVAPTIDLHQWFENRAMAAAKGLGDQPEFSFAPSGQGRGGRPYWPTNKNVFAPRVSLAYSPGFKEGLLAALFGGPGKSSIRAGLGLYYDHFGEGIVDGFSQFGSFGLTSTQAAPSNILTPDDAPRYTSRTNVPVAILPPANPRVSYPATPPDDPNGAGFTFNSNGIDGRLKNPYSIAMNFSIQRELRGGFTLETAYVGRLGRHLLQQLDLAMATDLVDPKSGMDYFTAARLMSQFATANGENPKAVIAPIPYFEDLFPSAAAGGFSATQNIYTGALGSSACPISFSGFRWANRPGREIGAPFRLGLLDTTLAHGGVSPVCAGLPPVPFWDPQFSSLMAWSSIGVSSYHAAQFIVRHPMKHGLQLDFSYTFGKSMDMGSDAERTNSQGTTSTTAAGLGPGSTTRSFIENSWNPRLNYAPSDFDIRHVVTTNWVYQLPFGQGKPFGSQAGRGLDALIGGWQLSGLARWTSALPFGVVDTRGFTNNFLFNSNLVQTAPIRVGLFHDAANGGAPSAFADPGGVIAGLPDSGVVGTNTPMRFAYPGEAGSRNNFRGQGFFGIDASLAKSWKFTERFNLKFAWDVFNVTNSVRFDTNSIDNGSDDGGGFGLYHNTLTSPRVQQLSLRVTF